LRNWNFYSSFHQKIVLAGEDPCQDLGNEIPVPKMRVRF
jgi:hypothetical protein